MEYFLPRTSETSMESDSLVDTDTPAESGNFGPCEFMGRFDAEPLFNGYMDTDNKIVVSKPVMQDSENYTMALHYVVEVARISKVGHPNLVKLNGYVKEANHTLLLLELIPQGFYKNYMPELDQCRELLDWNARIDIAAGTARGIQYLQNDLNHCDFSVMGKFGAQEFNEFTVNSNINILGTFMLDLVRGMKTTEAERNFLENTEWARTVDPRMKGDCPSTELDRVIKLVQECFQDSSKQPSISYLVEELENISSIRNQYVFVRKSVSSSHNSSTGRFLGTLRSPSSSLASQRVVPGTSELRTPDDTSELRTPDDTSESRTPDDDWEFI